MNWGDGGLGRFPFNKFCFKTSDDGFRVSGSFNQFDQTASRLLTDLETRHLHDGERGLEHFRDWIARAVDEFQLIWNADVVFPDRPHRSDGQCIRRGQDAIDAALLREQLFHRFQTIFEAALVSIDDVAVIPEDPAVGQCFEVAAVAVDKRDAVQRSIDQGDAFASSVQKDSSCIIGCLEIIEDHGINSVVDGPDCQDNWNAFGFQGLDVVAVGCGRGADESIDQSVLELVDVGGFDRRITIRLTDNNRVVFFPGG